MNTWSFYRIIDGKFSDFRFTGREKHLAINTPDGFAPLQGIFTSSSRVDMDTMNVVSCLPDKPQDTDYFTYVWSDEAGGWVSVPTEANLSNQARARRDALLSESDWTQLQDAPLTEQELQAWREYRQHLRDVPEREGFPQDFEWPTAPHAAAL